MTANVENIASALLIGRMPPEAQHDYARLLRELAQLFDNHADDQKPDDVPQGGGRHALREPPDESPPVA
ncbi:hypothetical protein [Amycolatopsis japonica]